MNDMKTIPAKCDLCQSDFMTDGYQWVCDACQHPPKDCECGSDDIELDWSIPLDQNGEITDKPMWTVSCNMCEVTTAYFETAKEAHDAWMNGHAEKAMIP